MTEQQQISRVLATLADPRTDSSMSKICYHISGYGNKFALIAISVRIIIVCYIIMKIHIDLISVLMIVNLQVLIMFLMIIHRYYYQYLIKLYHIMQEMANNRFNGYRNICIGIKIELHESNYEWNHLIFDDQIDNDYSHHDLVSQYILQHIIYIMVIYLGTDKDKFYHDNENTQHDHESSNSSIMYLRKLLCNYTSKTTDDKDVRIDMNTLNQ